MISYNLQLTLEYTLWLGHGNISFSFYLFISKFKQFIMRHELGFLKLLVLENKLDGVGTFQRGSEILQISHDAMGQNCATWLISRGMLVVTFRG